mgnify:CR=1 FL=1
MDEQKELKNVCPEGGMVRTITGRLRVMETGNRKLYRVELWMLNDQTNRNGWRYINLESHLAEFKDIPILTAYAMGGRRIGDGHNFTMRVDPETGEEYASFTDADAERIVGWLPKDANIRMERDGEINWIVGTGYLWRWYSKELVDKIARQGGGMEISIETLVTDSYMDGDVEVEREYVVLGVTVLGDGVVPAVAGANIQSLATLSAVRDGMKKEVLRAASYIGEQPQNETPKPKNNSKGVKQPMLSKQRMNALGKKFEGYTIVGASEDGGKVALLSTTHEPFGYSFAESDNGTVIPDRITAAAASAIFRYNGEEVEAELESVMEHLTRRINELEQENKTLNSNNGTLTAQIGEMQAREKARRLQAAKDAMKNALNAINAPLGKADRFDEEILRDLAARVDSGEFTDMVDAEGNWKGDEAVTREVKVLCMDETTKRAEKNRKISLWQRQNGADPSYKPATISEKLRDPNQKADD